MLHGLHEPGLWGPIGPIELERPHVLPPIPIDPARNHPCGQDTQPRRTVLPEIRRSSTNLAPLHPADPEDCCVRTAGPIRLIFRPISAQGTRAKTPNRRPLAIAPLGVAPFSRTRGVVRRRPAADSGNRRQQGRVDDDGQAVHDEHRRSKEANRPAVRNHLFDKYEHGDCGHRSDVHDAERDQDHE